jgi:predicted permease
MLQGRDFGPQDNEKSPHVAIVNEKFAQFYFGNTSPLGKKIAQGGQKPDFTIVGVAKDGKYSSLREKTPRFWYIPYEQRTNVQNLNLFIRTKQDPVQLAESIRRVIQGIDRNVPIYNVKTLEQQIDESISTDRLLATLSTFFSLLAALMAAIGLYGVMRYSVTRRTREIGIRMALGAQRSTVVQMVMREVVIFSALGIAIGLPTALALGKYVGSMLYGVKPADQLTLFAASLLMGVVALIAGYLPALRAAKVDPVIALRWE